MKTKRQLLRTGTMICMWAVLVCWTCPPAVSTYKIIVAAKTLPGTVNSKVTGKLDEPVRALAAFYSAMGGSDCDTVACGLTTALGLGTQGSAAHQALIRQYFPADKAARVALKQQCYLPPSGASAFTEYQYLTITRSNDTYKVSYTLVYYNRGASTRLVGPDTYVLRNKTFRTVQRKLWNWADKQP